MKFKRIDSDTVRCLISEDELWENGLSVDDFLKNDSKTEGFLRKVITMAEEEVGYKVKGGNITIQVSVLPDHILALTFSEKMDGGILGMLENLKSAVEKLSKTAKNEPQSEIKSDVVQKPQNTKAAKETAEEQVQNTFLIDESDSFQLCFVSLDMIGEYCASVVPEVPIKSSVYKLDEEYMYFLIMEKGDMDKRQLCRMLGASLEFSIGIYAHRGAEAYIKEHGTCIVEKDAIAVLQEVYAE